MAQLATLPAPPPDLEGVRVSVRTTRVSGFPLTRFGRLVSGDPLRDREGSAVVHFDGDASPTFGVNAADVTILPADHEAP